ncbi:MAG: CPBP family intramembrane metalloprotease [Propionibacteriaceae bacterium]|nr:CPBP family intramembrane metalloprotease [Propionibacteriaceae bacterium]
MAAWTRPPAGVTYAESLLDAQDSPGDPRLVSQGALLVIGAIAGYFVLYLGGTHAVAALGWLVTGRDGAYSDFYDAAVTGFGSPWGIWAAHFGLSILVLGAWAYYRLACHRRLAWLWSVMPGVRWRYGLLCLIAALILFGGYAGVTFAAGPGWQPPPDWVWYLVPIVVTSPLQALGEEVLFRGLLLQALGLIVPRPWFPVLFSALLFAFFHGAQNPWLFASRFVFGILAGALVWRTGGLEAGVAAHAANNLAAFGLALVTGELTQTRTVTEITPLAALGEAGLFAAVAAAAWGLAHVLRVPNRAPAA